MPLDTFFSVSQQVRFLLLSAVLGAAMGVVYDVFRTIRILFPPAGGKAATAVSDIIFWVMYAAALFVFAFNVSGDVVRGYMVMGSLCGFILYILSAGSVVTGIFRFIAEQISAAAVKIRSLCQKIPPLFVRNGKNDVN